MTKLLVGNKADLTDKRVVKVDLAEVIMTVNISDILYIMSPFYFLPPRTGVIAAFGAQPCGDISEVKFLRVFWKVHKGRNIFSGNNI